MLSDSTRTRIQEEVARYPKRRTALLPALKLAQDDLGYLPSEAVAEVADLVGISHPAANELATFYSMLHTEPVGRAKVQVCVQLPCAVKGAERLLRRLSEGLGIAPGETTADGSVTLERTPECMGGCHRAPMCRVNEAYHENLDAAATERLLEQLKSGALGAARQAETPVRAGAESRPSGEEDAA